MFNEKCATNVSTVQLSERLHISPGNLYYYYDNKEHLIKSIWEEDICPIIEKIFSREDFGHSENGILNLFNDYLNVMNTYRFFYMELYALLHNDPDLKTIYVEHFNKIKERMYVVFDAWTEIGIMKPAGSEVKSVFADNLWVIGQKWSDYADKMYGYKDQASIVKDTIIHISCMLAPYFTDQANERMQILLKNRGFLHDTENDTAE